MGYCGIARYKDSAFVRNNPTAYPTLAGLSPAAISPYDDHVGGRHGTILSAIISQNANVNILPVKIFDNNGNGLLFDVLCGFNYIIQRKKSGENIQVVNCSWVCNYDSVLLKNNIKALCRLGVLVVAAAGNASDTERS